MRPGPAWVLYVTLALAAPLAGQASGGAPPLEVLQGFTLIDGLGGPPVRDAALAVRGSLIVDAGPRREVLARSELAEAPILVDLGGGFVVPGLIDAHVHLASSPNRSAAERELRRLLYAGVTTVRDMAGDARALASLARDAGVGEIEGPDIYFAALMAGPSFFFDPRARTAAAGARAGDVPWLQAITPDTDLVLAVARARGTSATGIKIYADLDAETVRRITDEAHRQGLRVWAHAAVFPARPLEVVTAGVDVVSHACRLAWEAVTEIPARYHRDRAPPFDAMSVDAAVFEELFAEMRERGTILDATLAMHARADRARDGDPQATEPLCRTDFARRLVRKAHDEGVSIAAGTDFATPPQAAFPALHDELEELVAHAGLTPLEAIAAATRTAAAAIGIEDTHGTLQPGTVLSFVLLDEDPTLDIGNLRSVREVWKNAERFRRADYRPPGG